MNRTVIAVAIGAAVLITACGSGGASTHSSTPTPLASFADEGRLCAALNAGADVKTVAQALHVSAAQVAEAAHALMQVRQGKIASCP
jgi:hypothetical protein